MLACRPSHLLPIHNPQSSRGLTSEKDIFRNQQLGDDTKLLVNHSDAGRKRIACGVKQNRNSVQPHRPPKAATFGTSREARHTYAKVSRECVAFLTQLSEKRK